MIPVIIALIYGESSGIYLSLIHIWGEEVFWFKKKGGKPKAAIFVDYEHWYYGYRNNFQMKPNIEEWLKELEDEYEISRLYIFGDFSKYNIGMDLELSLIHILMKFPYCERPSRKKHILTAIRTLRFRMMKSAVFRQYRKMAAKPSLLKTADLYLQAVKN